MVKINEDDPNAEQLIVSKTYIRRRHRHHSQNSRSSERNVNKEEEEGGEEKEYKDQDQEMKNDEENDEEEEEEEEIVTHYIKGRFIGKGGFARVYEFRCLENGQVYAGKVIPKCSVTTGNQKRKLITEIRIHRSLSHPNIVRFVQSFTDEDNYYIVLELCRHQTLLDVLRCRGHLPEREARYWLSQLLRALAYLRGVLVLHRDLKLGNLFVCDGMVLKVGDFGLSASMASAADRKRSICGTPNYIAPEVLASGPAGGHGLEVDIWSFGVILYTLLVGAHPFEGRGSKETYARIRSGSYAFPGAARISAEARDLIGHILVTDPAARYTLDQVAAHPFFTAAPIPETLPLHALVTDPLPSSPSSPSQTLQIQTPFIGQQGQQKDEGNCAEKASKQQGGEKATFAPKKKRKSPAAEIYEEPYAPPPGLCELNALKHAVLHALDVSLEAQAAEQYVPVPRLPSSLPPPPSSTSSSPAEGAGFQGLGIPQGERVATVRKWVDYSQQYGLGYLLSDGSVGAYYNDTSKIVLTRKRRYKSDDCNDDNDDDEKGEGDCCQPPHRCVKYIYENTITSYRTNEDGETKLDLSHDRLKKLRIVNSFRTFLCDPTTCSNEVVCPKTTTTAPSSSSSAGMETVSAAEVMDVEAETVEVFRDAEEEMEAEVVMVTHYYKLQDGIAFRFSNGSMQINFANRARLLIVPWWKAPTRFLGAENPVPAEAKRELIMSALHAINKLIRRYSKPQAGGPLKEVVRNGMAQRQGTAGTAKYEDGNRNGNDENKVAH